MAEEEHQGLLNLQGDPHGIFENEVNDEPRRTQRQGNGFCRNLFLNILYLLYSISKIVVAFVILRRSNVKCKEPLDAWIMLVMINELGFVVYIVLSMTANYSVFKERIENQVPFNDIYEGSNQRYSTNTLISELNNLDNYNHFAHINEQGESKYKFLTLMRHSNQFFYLITFIWGTFLYFSNESDCEKVNPELNNLCFIYLIISSAYIFFPLIIICTICLCIPCLVFSMLMFNRSGMTPTKKDIIDKLPDIEYEAEKFPEHEACIICLANFEKGEKLIILPCSNKHYFHSQCIKTWLNIHSHCPVCKKDLNKEEAILPDPRDRHSFILNFED